MEVGQDCLDVESAERAVIISEYLDYLCFIIDGAAVRQNHRRMSNGPETTPVKRAKIVPDRSSIQN